MAQVLTLGVGPIALDSQSCLQQPPASPARLGMELRRCWGYGAGCARGLGVPDTLRVGAAGGASLKAGPQIWKGFRSPDRQFLFAA